MLHEILISLSGVSSPIWTQVRNGGETESHGIRDYVSAPEQVMLKELSHLSDLHVKLREHCTSISTNHPSIVCRGISTSISNTHLAAFRKKIVDVESSILRHDAGYVGGYDIVPLSTILAHFSPWSSRLEWLLKITKYMMKTTSREDRAAGSCAEICRVLDHERHTGYADIESMATDLLKTAQSVWMGYVSSWVLYGQLPTVGIHDFMIQRSATIRFGNRFELKHDLAPIFVTRSCANVMLAIGSALNQLYSTSKLTSGPAVPSNVITQLLSSNLPQIKSLSYPLNPSLLEAVMNNINQTISSSVLSQLLPLQKVTEVVHVIKNYLLLGRGEFALSLIQNADERFLNRSRMYNSSQPVRKLGKVEDVSLKAAELSTILLKTWSDLSALQSDLESEEDAFLMAKRCLRLSMADESKIGDLPTTLTPSPTLLRLELPADSPLKLFLTPEDIERYAKINAYLLSIRRAELHVSGLWKLTGHRRCYPSPLAPPMSATPVGKRALMQRRARENARNLRIRRHWSSMNSTLFLLNELGAYLHGEVIHNSWQHFIEWLTLSKEESGLGRSAMKSSTVSSPSKTNKIDDQSSIQSMDVTARAKSTNSDPRIIAQAHQACLNSLSSALLLEDSNFVNTLQRLLHLIDHCVALFIQLQKIWEGLDLQEDDGVMDAFTNYAQDEKDVFSEMDRSRTELDSLLTRLVDNIKQIEKDQDTHVVTSGIATVTLQSDATGGFVPWKVRTLDRLIMKLDFLQGGIKTDSDEDDEFVDAL